MEKNSFIIEEWKSSSGKVFWGIVLISFAGIFSTIYDYISYLVDLFDIVRGYASSIIRTMGGSAEVQLFDMTDIIGLGLSSKLLVVIGYILYLWGLSSFAKIQRLESTQQNVLKVRKAAILLIVAFFLSIVFGVLSIIPFAGWLFGIIIWILTLYCFYKMRNAFTGLMSAEDFDERARRGARNARFGAVCEIRLKWLPLIVATAILLIVGFAVFYLSSRNSLTGAEGLIKIVGIMIGATLFMAFISTVCLIVGAFWWPIMGWYRIKTGSPSPEMTEVKKAVSDSEAMSSMAVSEHEEAFVQEGFDSDDDEQKKKYYYIGGGVVAVLAILIGIFTCSGSKSKGGNDLLPVEKPMWEMFVVITQDTPLYKEADKGSPKLSVTQENLESDAIVRNFKWNNVPDRRGWTSYDVMVTSDVVLPVVLEYGDWYRVVYEDSEMGTAECYVQKTNCREVKPEPITAEVLAHITDYDYYRANFGLQTEGKYKNICFISIMADMDGNYVDVAVLTDGKLINPLTRRIFTAWQRCADAAFEDVEGQLAYREDMEQDGMFDARNIKTEADAELLFNAMPMNQSDYQKVAYFFPEISKTKLFVFTQNFEEASSSVISEAQDDPEDPEITQALNDFQDLIERVHGMVEECEKTGEMTGNTICQEVEEARDELNEKVNRMSEEQILQFEALCQKAKDLIQYADSVNNIATVAVAVDSAIVEM